MITIRTLGINTAQAYMQRLADGARASGGAAVVVGSPLKYAYGIETGRRRSGKLARRAGGAWYLTGGLAAVRPRIRGELAKALPDGAGATRAALLKLGYDVQRGAQQRVPVVTGSLRRSLHTVMR